MKALCLCICLLWGLLVTHNIAGADPNIHLTDEQIADTLVIDIAGTARLILVKDTQQPDIWSQGIQLVHTLGEQLQTLKFMGYDTDQQLQQWPVLAVHPNLMGIPTLFINGRAFVAANLESAQAHGMSSQQLAAYWLEQLKPVITHLKHIQASAIQMRRADEILAAMPQAPEPAQVNLGSELIMRLPHSRAKLMTAQQRAALAFESIRQELDYAMNHKTDYKADRIRHESRNGEFWIMAGANPVCVVTAEDALHHHSSARALADRWTKQLQLSMVKRIFHKKYQEQC